MPRNFHFVRGRGGAYGTPGGVEADKYTTWEALEREGEGFAEKTCSQIAKAWEKTRRKELITVGALAALL